MKPKHGYAVCPACHRKNIHATEDGKLAKHHANINDTKPCSGSGKKAENCHDKPIKSESMKSAPKISPVSAFLGEAAPAPEAVVKVEVTGTPAKVQSAIKKLAARGGGGAKRPVGAGKPVDDLVPKIPETDDMDGGDGGDGGDEGELPPPPPAKSSKEKAVDVVEALIGEEPKAQ